MKNNDIFASINFLPVCSACGKILYNIEIGVIDDDVSDFATGHDGIIYKNRHQSVVPHHCPYCNKIFEAIHVPAKFPFESKLYDDLL